MNYHNITTSDMMNGEGLRVVLWLSGCNHHCKNCHNPQTWDPNSGIEFDDNAKEEIFQELKKDYISGITFSGGDPLHKNNLKDVLNLCKEVKEKFPTKTIWIYSGYTWEQIFKNTYLIDLMQNLQQLSEFYRQMIYRQMIIFNCDVFIDGKFVEELSDINYHWAGSTNQRVIDIQKSLKENRVILFED